MEELENQKKQLSDQCREYKYKLDQKNAYQYSFDYSDPEPNFDRNRVKGMVCNLFDVQNNRDSLALSMCSGGSVCRCILFNPFSIQFHVFKILVISSSYRHQ